MIRVYVASKIRHARKFRILRAEWSNEGIDLHARWHEQAEHEEDASPDDFKIFWLVDEEDVRRAAFVIAYAEPGDALHGALVESGMALALGIPVIVVGESPSYGTWQHHPLVFKASSLVHAKNMILNRLGGSRS